VRSLAYLGRELDLKLPMLESLLPSNEVHIQRGIDLVLQTGKKKVGVLGLSFKPDTDDLRESPMIELVKALIGEGCQVKIFDEKVKLSSIVGANREFVEKEIPHIGALLHATLEDVVKDSEVIVVGRDAREFHGLRELLRAEHTVIELARSKNFEGGAWRHVGICW
jgi:GDP-mannose 6-dehydrogenase